MYVKMHISHTKSFNIPVSIALATLAHKINVYEIYFNTTNYLIFNMQDFRYCLWTSILDCYPNNVREAYTIECADEDFIAPSLINELRGFLGRHHLINGFNLQEIEFLLYSICIQ